MKSVLKTAKTGFNCRRLCQCFHCQCSHVNGDVGPGGWSSLLRGHEKTRSTHGASCRPARQRLPIFGGPTRQRRSSHVPARFLRPRPAAGLLPAITFLFRPEATNTLSAAHEASCLNPLFRNPRSLRMTFDPDSRSDPSEPGVHVKLVRMRSTVRTTLRNS
jgi:hypothetical protein